MELTQTTVAAANKTGGDANKPGDGRTSLTSDYEMFLQMLTTQMTNQDPLNPVDSSDYAVQLATFSSVEQQVLTNDLLSELTAKLGNSGLSDLAAYVGREVRSTAPVQFDGSPIDVFTGIATGADAARLTVRDATGKTVQEFDLDPGQNRVAWTGMLESGAYMEHGVYSFETTSFSSGEVIEQSPAAAYGRIVEAQTTPSGLELILDGGVAIAPSDVTAMRQ